MISPLGVGKPKPALDTFRADYDLTHTFMLHRLPSAMPGGRIYRFVAACYRYVRRHRPDFVFTISPFCGLAAAWAGARVIFEGHEAVHGRLRNRCLRLLLKHKRMRCLITVSSALKAHYVEGYGVPAHRVHVARNAADEVETPPPSVPEARLSAGYAGSLGAGPDSGRGIDILLQAAGRLPDVDFHLYGGSAGQVSYWKQKSALPNVHYHGHVPLRELKRNLCAMDVLLAPYQPSVYVSDGLDSARYMSPMKVFDYLAQGKAIVASRLPAIEEVLEDESNALLCDPVKAAEWVEAIARLRKDPAERQRLGAEARALWSRSYRWSDRARTILSHAGLEAPG